MEEKLSNLPGSHNDFWEDSETNQHKMGVKEECEHFFEEDGERKIKCKKCGMGLFIDVEDEIRDGHLFCVNKLII